MSDLSDIHNKINRVSDQLSYLVGKCDTFFPMLVTKDEVHGEIAQHRINCKAARASAITDPPLARNANWKLWAQIGTGLGAAVATAIALLSALNN